MKLPTEIEDRYVKEVLANTSLQNLPGEEWIPIENFENYAISNYGRVKSLERWVINLHGIKRKVLDSIKKPHVFRYFNKYVNTHFYNVRCTLSLEGKKYGKSIPRLVYYHFVEKFDVNDNSFFISFKDDNQFYVHSSNLEKLSVSDVHYKTLRSGRGNRSDYAQAVNQYTTTGDLVASFESIYCASKFLGISHTSIMPVIKRKRLTAGRFRWFPKEYSPTKEDFIVTTKNKFEKVLNTSLWKKLGQPKIDKSNPPACMNLSLKDLPGEEWKPIPGLEDYFDISNKGRVKRLNSWTQNKNKTFLTEHIISLFLDIHSNESYYLYTDLSCNGKRIQIRITRLLYFCFVKQFDMNDRALVIVNENEPLWDLDISKLKLKTRNSLLKRKDK